jgi:nitrite transporter NirC
VGALFAWSLIGNLIGSLAVAWMVVQSGVVSAAPQAVLLQKVAGIKMSLPAWELFLRGILCNWLVCLAVWTASRTTSDAAKILLIFWCLFAFIGSGFEHSIANQSLLGLALFLPHEAGVSWAGFAWNQTWVILGNVVGGGFLVGGLYWLASPVRRADAPETIREGKAPVLIEREEPA